MDNLLEPIKTIIANTTVLMKKLITIETKVDKLEVDIRILKRELLKSIKDKNG